MRKRREIRSKWRRRWWWRRRRRKRGDIGGIATNDNNEDKGNVTIEDNKEE